MTEKQIISAMEKILPDALAFVPELGPELSVAAKSLPTIVNLVEETFAPGTTAAVKTQGALLAATVVANAAAGVSTKGQKKTLIDVTAALEGSVEALQAFLSPAPSPAAAAGQAGG